MMSSAIFPDARRAELLDSVDLIVDQLFHRVEAEPLGLEHFLRHGKLRLVESRQVEWRRIRDRPNAARQCGKLSEVLENRSPRITAPRTSAAPWIGRRIRDDVGHSGEGCFKLVDA